jgi:hypothetical protein
MNSDHYLAAMILVGAMMVAVPVLIIFDRQSEAAASALVIGFLAMLAISMLKPPPKLKERVLSALRARTRTRVMLRAFGRFVS